MLSKHSGKYFMVAVGDKGGTKGRCWALEKCLVQGSHLVMSPCRGDCVTLGTQPLRILFTLQSNRQLMEMIETSEVDLMQ